MIKKAFLLLAALAILIFLAVSLPLHPQKPRPNPPASSGPIIVAAIVNGNTNASGEISIPFPENKFTLTPQLAATAQFSADRQGQMGKVNVININRGSFTLRILNGMGVPAVGSVQISYVAVQ
jgi:hypothetical protein